MTRRKTMTVVQSPLLGEEFDPDLHQVDANGDPRRDADGNLVRKRGRPRGATTSPSAPSRAVKGTDYRPGIVGLLQLAAAPLAFTYPADALAVTHHAPPIAQALQDLATSRPEVAAVLDKVMSVGPYGALIAAVVPLAVQLLHNHDLLPEQMAVQLGATPKRDIMAALRAQAAAAGPPAEQPAAA